MKKIILVVVVSVCSFYLWSQQGTFQVTSGAFIKTAGDAYMVLNNMHIVNDGSFQQTPGNGIVKLTGPLNVDLSGSGPLTLNQLLMNKNAPGSLNLQSNLSVISKVTFNGGLLNLNNNILDLSTTGSLVGESEFSRAYTTGTGYIQATGILNNPTAADLGSLGAVITSTKNLGNTVIKRGHQVQTGVSGSNNSIMRYYDIMPANNMGLKATLRFRYFDAELNSIPEGSLHQWKSINLVNWELMGADSRNQADNYVERSNYSKFDRLTLAIATAPTITCPANQTVSANLNGCKASVSFAATATGIPPPLITYRIGNTMITSPHVFSKGTTTVTATASNGVSPNATCTFTVTVVCGPVTSASIDGIPQAETVVQNLMMTARPNPSANYFTLNIKSEDRGPVTVRIVDVLGRVISNQSIVSSNTTLSVGHKFAPGIYFVQAIQGDRIVQLRLVKQ